MATGDRERNDQGRSGEQHPVTGTEEHLSEREPIIRADQVARTLDDMEASETDGAGTGGVGEDAGGYGPVPGSEASG